MILLSILSVQVGAALAKHLFSALGPAGVVFLRTAFAALVLFLAWRPQVRGHDWKQYRAAFAFGATIALMNLTFYASLDRLPIGIAVTLEFVGPLGVAILGSRRWLDVCWAVLAGLGVILLSPITDAAVEGSFTRHDSNDVNEVQISTDGANYFSNLTLAPTENTVPSTTIYVRLYSEAEGDFNGNITHVSAGATTKNIAVSGSVSWSQTVSLEATADTYLSANDVTYNNGGNTQLHVDATTDTSRRTTLLQWDLSSIPTNALVTSASLSLYVEDASPLTFNLYNMRRAWIEGTGNRTASTTSANWNAYDGTNSWGTAGAANTTADRYDANLWGAGTTSFSSTGSKTVDLNSEGVAVVQGWINDTVFSAWRVVKTDS